LAALAPLGPVAQVHLAPKIPPGLLNTALATFLSLQPDELLLALIDGGAGGLEGCCALTTRRVYWTAADTRDSDSSQARTFRLGRARRRPLRSHVICYEDVARVNAESLQPDRSLLDLGDGQKLILKTTDIRLARSLAKYLESMGSVARTGVAPALSESDPELAQRVARAWPAVAQVTSRARNLGRDMLVFRRALDAATPVAYVTPVLILACVAVYALMVYSGVSPLWPSGSQLVGWGANEGARIILRHEYWRLISSAFVHGGLIHLALNMWSLLVIGPLVERLYGNAAYAVLYLAAGVGGAIASVAWSPVRVSVGASGAICGVLGALVAFLLVHRRSIPLLVLRPLRANAIGYVVFIAILGALVPNIDQQAHLGGLAVGFVGGLVLSRPWPVRKGKWTGLRRVAVTILIAASLEGAAVALTRRGAMKLPAVMRFQHVEEQITGPLEEFNAIGDAIPSSLALKRDRADPQARQEYLNNLQMLVRRGTTNLVRLTRVTTPDPGLRGIVDALVSAQTAQRARVEAARRFLESGDAEAITGDEGFLAKKAATDQAVRAFQEQQFRYLTDQGLIAKRAPSKP
jgi:rhomboid protease GluP